MNRLFNFARSELFLSLVGGFALGVAGLAIVKPASADVVPGGTGAVSVEAPLHVAPNAVE